MKFWYQLSKQWLLAGLSGDDGHGALANILAYIDENIWGGCPITGREMSTYLYNKEIFAGIRLFYAFSGVSIKFN